MQRKTMNTSYSPENHGRGYKQTLKKIIFQRLLGQQASILVKRSRVTGV
jgi:hypothetical protein